MERAWLSQFLWNGAASEQVDVAAKNKPIVVLRLVAYFEER
jgi:hypothetical protein